MRSRLRLRLSAKLFEMVRLGELLIVRLKLLQPCGQTLRAPVPFAQPVGERQLVVRLMAVPIETHLRDEKLARGWLLRLPRGVFGKHPGGQQLGGGPVQMALNPATGQRMASGVCPAVARWDMHDP